MHHRKSQHVQTSNASQSEPLSFVYFYPQLGLKKKLFLPSCFMGKNYFPGKAGDMPFVRDKAFYEEKPFSANAAFLTSKLNSYLFITECKPCRKQQSCNYCIYYSKTKINFMLHRMSQHVKTSTPATTVVNTSKQILF